MKKFLFNYFGCISAILFSLIIAGSFVLEFLGYQLRWQITVTILSLIVTSSFLIQRQKLQETKLFSKLFKDFNNRYDEMNESLVNIRNKKELDPEDESHLVDYFNLCAEEYLFKKRGYIPSDVWKSWKNGMAFYMKDDNIKQLWLKERESESYYGLEMLNYE